MQIKRWFNNLIGKLLGFEECVFCQDRANWKPWMDSFNVGESKDGNKINEYDPPICNDCFWSQPLNALLHAVKADITEDNNFYRNFGAVPPYSDDAQEHIISAIEALKSKNGGT